MMSDETAAVSLVEIVADHARRDTQRMATLTALSEDDEAS